MEQRHSRHYPIHDRIHLLPCHLQRIHQDFLIPIHNNLALVTLHDFYMPSYELIISYSVGSDDRDMRRLVLSPVPSSFDSRRTSSEDSYTNDGESSFDDRAEVEASLTADPADDDDQQGWSSGYSSTGSHVTGSGSGTGTGSYVGSSSNITEPLNFDRERRVLSVISERTEQSALSGGTGNNAGGIFSTLLSRPTSFLSNAAASSADVLRRSLYGQPISPLTHSEGLSSPRSPGSSAHSLPPIPVIRGDSRPATPERIFRPVPPTGRRVGDLVATFESNLDSPSLQRPIGPRSPSPYSTSRPSSPLKAASQSSYTSYTQCRTGTGIGLGIITATPSQSVSTLLSPPATQTATSETDRTVRTRSPFTSVRNIVSAWKERTPTRGGSSIVSGTTSASGAPFGLGDNVFSLRRRGAITSRVTQRSAAAPPPYEEVGGSVGGNGNGNGSGRGQSLTRTLSRRSTATAQSESAVSIDLSELSSLVRGNEEVSFLSRLNFAGLLMSMVQIPSRGIIAFMQIGIILVLTVFLFFRLCNQTDTQALRSGHLWYLNVHAPPPYMWQRCQAILYPSTLVLTWLAPGGGRGVVTLDLINCNEIRSVPAPSHPSARDDVGTIAARLQMDMASRGEQDVSYNLVDMLYPFQLIYSDGVERLGTESAAERVRWVGAIWYLSPLSDVYYSLFILIYFREAIDSSSTIPDRSLTGSPTGSIRTIRSIQSSGRSVSENGSGDGSASTIFVANLDLPEIPDFGDSSTFTRTYTQESTTSYAPTRTGTYATGSRLRATDDGAISSRGLLHPLDSRGIEITPSRSGSLRRTSSLTDLDARYAGVIDFGDNSGARERSSARGSLSRFSARWSGTREGSELSYASSSEIGVGDSISQVGAVRRVPASTFYSLSSGSESGSASYRTASSSQPLIESTLASIRSPTYTTEEGTEIVASTLSLRRPDSASLLGDSHSGPTASEPRLLSPTTPTRPALSAGTTSPSRSRALSPTSMSYSGGYSESSGRTPESLYTTSSGLSRRSEVRRRTPRRSSRTYSSPRTVSSSERSGTGTVPSESSDKENEPDEPEDQSSSKTHSESGRESAWEVNNRSEWTSLDSRSFTTTTYDSRWMYSSREPTEYSERTPSERTPSERWPSERAISERESEEEDLFATPTSRSASYHSAPSPPKTPTPSIPSISTAYDTAEKAPSSTAYESLEICPSPPPSTDYTTAEICPSSTDFTTAEICPSSPRSTDYMSAECRCIPSEPSLRTEISSLTPSITLSELFSEKAISPEAASLYAPSEVPTIPSVIEEAEIPLPVSEDELLSDEPVAPEPSVSEPALSTPTSPSVMQVPTPEAPVSEAAPSTPTSGPAVRLVPSERAVSEHVPSTPSSVAVRELTPSVSGPSEGPLSSPSSVAVRQLAPSMRTISERGISSPSSGTTPIVTSEVPSTPFVESPSARSLLSSIISMSAESTTSVSPTTESDVTPIPSTLTLESPGISDLTASPSVRAISVELPSLPSFLSSPTTPSSPSILSLHTESDLTPKSKSIYVPSHTSAPTIPSISEYDSSVLAPSPSLQSLPTPEPVDVSFETSFLRPSGSEVFSEQGPSPFLPKEPEIWKEREISQTPSTTDTPSSMSIGTTSFGPTVTVTRTPSTISSVSVESYRSSILYPKSIWEEELSSPSTEPSLLSSRPTTPRPVGNCLLIIDIKLI